MKLGIMQPYFLPYFGYFQLISETNHFLLHDDLQYTKKGWINRNRFLLNNHSNIFTVATEKNAHTYLVGEKKVSEQFCRIALLRKFFSAYKKAPYFKKHFPIIEEIVLFENNFLFQYIEHSIFKICKLLEINTNILRPSSLHLGSHLKGEDRVITICQKKGATEYINSANGKNLYSKERFRFHGIHLSFINPERLEYVQYENHFVPNLSIIDPLMFNDTSKLIRFCKTGYILE